MQISTSRGWQSHLYQGRTSGCALFLLACIHPVMSCRAGWIFHPSMSLGSFGSSKQAAPCMRARIMCANLFYLVIDDFAWLAFASVLRTRLGEHQVGVRISGLWAKAKARFDSNPTILRWGQCDQIWWNFATSAILVGLLSIWQIFEPILANVYGIGQLFIIWNDQIANL